MGLIYLPERGIQGWFLPDDTLYWDQEHPLLKDAILAFAFVNGHWMNLLTGRRAAIGTTTAISSSSMGRVVRTLATNTSYVNTNITPTVTEAKIAYLGTISLNASAAGGGILSSKASTGNGGGIVNATGPILRSSFEATDGANLDSGNLPVTYGKLLPFCATADASTNDFYLGGVKATQGTGKTCSTTTLSGSATLSLGRRGTYYTETSSNLIIVRQEKITDRQYEAFVSAPFDMFHKRRIWVPVSSAVGQTLTPSLVTNSQTFHAATVTRGAVTLTPSLVTNSQTFHASMVTTGAVTLASSLVTNGQTFHAPTVSTGSVTLSPSLVTNGQTFYAPVVSSGGATLAPSLVTNSQTFPSPTISVGAVTLTLDVVVNGQTFYAPTVAQPSGQTLEPTLVTNGQTFYGPTVEGMLLTQADLDAIAAAVWADPAAVAAHAKLDTIIARITC